MSDEKVIWETGRGYKVIFSEWFSEYDKETFIKVKVLDSNNLPILIADYTKVEPCQGIAEEYAECVEIMKFAGMYGVDNNKEEIPNEQ